MREVALMPKATHAQESRRAVERRPLRSPPLRAMDLHSGGSAVLRGPRRGDTDRAPAPTSVPRASFRHLAVL